MKLVDRMKDEELGTAILYNFTKGYGKPVPLELYDVVLPLLYHDFIREHVLTYTSLQECIYQCIQNEKHFKQHLLEKIEDELFRLKVHIKNRKRVQVIEIMIFLHEIIMLYNQIVI